MRYARYTRFLIIIMASIFFAPAAKAASIAITPVAPIQGDPIMITVPGASLSQVDSISIGLASTSATSLYFFSYKGVPTAFYGFGIASKVGQYTVQARLSDGSSISGYVSLSARPHVVAALSIPQSLGGNTAAAAQNVVSELSKENAVIASVASIKKKEWVSAFRYPVANPVVTDVYGYNRQTGGQSTVEIVHKGTDFHAPVGTKVYAMNAGRVALVGSYPIYGKMIIIDHGLGLMTMYLHLSSIAVNKGQSVKAGALIGLSGETGYAEGPHLHVSVRLNGQSIDPQVFMKFFAQ
jgi:murein DD-endopeptidase MepM/ murein hydrolase activator NlpD